MSANCLRFENPFTLNDRRCRGESTAWKVVSESKPCFLVSLSGQAANRNFLHVIGKRFRKVEFVLQNGSPEIQTRRPVRNTHEVTILTSKSGNKVHHAELPSVERWRLGLNGCQATREPAVFGTVGNLVDVQRLDGINRYRNGETAGHRIDGLRGVHQQHPLVLRLSLHV